MSTSVGSLFETEAFSSSVLALGSSYAVFIMLQRAGADSEVSSEVTSLFIKKVAAVASLGFGVMACGESLGLRLAGALGAQCGKYLASRWGSEKPAPRFRLTATLSHAVIDGSIAAMGAVAGYGIKKSFEETSVLNKTVVAAGSVLFGLSATLLGIGLHSKVAS